MCLYIYIATVTVTIFQGNLRGGRQQICETTQ